MPEQVTSEEEWVDYEMSRGELAGAPETMGCYECFWVEDRKKNPNRKHITHEELKPVERKVVRLGPTVNPNDPTQSYKLECGHYAI